MISLSLIILAEAAVGLPAKPVDPLDQVKCVRENVTGSLVQKRKVCHTEREWRRIRGDAEQEARRITQPGTTNEFN